MWQHTRALLGSVRRKVAAALGAGSLAAIAALTFASVVREGLEVVLFSAALAPRYPALDLAWSGALGFALSAGIVWAILRGAARIDLQRFFAVTGLLLVLMAAGLLVHAVHAATDLGLLGPAPALWDLSPWLPDEGAAGRVLHALVGYTAAPTLPQALLYFGYVFGAGGAYLGSLAPSTVARPTRARARSRGSASPRRWPRGCSSRRPSEWAPRTPSAS